MAKADNPDGGSNIRIQMQVSDVSSPELYDNLLATKVNSRRHRVAYLATLGLMLERSMLKGGMATVSKDAIKETAVTAAKRKVKTQQASTVTPVVVVGDIKHEQDDVLVIPDNFGSDLLAEMGES